MGLGQPHDDLRDEPYWLELAEPRDERQERWTLAWAQTFAFVLDLCSPPGGDEWTGKGIEEATGGRVGARYFDALAGGRVYAPVDCKLEAIEEVMGIPGGAVYNRVEWWRRVLEEWRRGKSFEDAARAADDENAKTRIGRLSNGLFERFGGKYGLPETDGELAEASGGRLSAKDVRRISDGSIPAPAPFQLAAFCDIFRVRYSYWEGKEAPPKAPQFLIEIMNGKSYGVSPAEEGSTMLRILVGQLSHEEKIAVSSDESSAL